MKPIHLTLSMPFAKTAPDASRFWGNPSLPAGSAYPSYVGEDGKEYNYRFICQINLSELRPYDTDKLLPSEGLLLFFAKIDRYMGCFDGGSVSGYISDAEDVKVIYLADCDGVEEYVLLDEDGMPVAPDEKEIRFSLEPTDFSNEHALFASPDHREWDNWDEPFEDWQILLQVDSFLGMDFYLNFMDCGVLDFLISPDDLKTRKFDNVRAIVLST